MRLIFLALTLQWVYTIKCEAVGSPQLKILWQPELTGHIEVTVVYRWDKVSCPRCGEVIHKEQDRRLKDKVVFLTLVKKYLIRVVDS